jgi:flagellar L-ring protein FlgH
MYRIDAPRYSLIQLAAFGALLILAMLSLGCMAVQQAYEPHPVVAPLEALAAEAQPRPPEAKPTRGAIWTTDAQVNWFGDDKAARRGDTVLVKVVQKTSGTKQANTGTQRDSSISAKILYFLGMEKPINNLTDYSAVDANGAKTAWNPNNLIDATSSNKFKSTGSTDRSDTLQATVSAIVTDVLRNGNLVIYGHQTVTLNNEASVLTVQGIIRPSDIGDDNTIDSTRLTNANIEFTGSGVLTDKQHPGWATRVFDWVWPF